MTDLRKPAIVFSDVDGTLLDIHTRQWRPAAQWLARFVASATPVILCGSKTAAEMMRIQRELGLSGQPFIAENGAVIQLDQRWRDDPDYPRLIAGASHDEIRRILARLRAEGYKFTGFADVTETEIGDWTGLDRRLAALARRQEASETLIWRDSDRRMADFTAALAGSGLRLVAGTRFWHVLDARGDIARAAALLMRRYQQREGERRISLGLGDGPNDAPLLEITDYAVVVRGLSRDGIVLRNDDPQRVYRTRQSGPAGWREGMTHFFGDAGAP